MCCSVAELAPGYTLRMRHSCVLVEGRCTIDFNKLEALINGKYGKNKANRILTSLLADAGIAERG